MLCAIYVHAVHRVESTPVCSFGVDYILLNACPRKEGLEFAYVFKSLFPDVCLCACVKIKNHSRSGRTNRCGSRNYVKVLIVLEILRTSRISTFLLYIGSYVVTFIVGSYFLLW